jgi:hypothetical protein
MEGKSVTHRCGDFRPPKFASQAEESFGNAAYSTLTPPHNQERLATAAVTLNGILT